MSTRIQASSRRRRKMITFIWTGLLSLVVILLIYWEKTALLYILATLGVTALLVVVATADLDRQKSPASLSAPEDLPGPGGSSRSNASRARS